MTIILTAYPGTESAIEGIHLGIDEYIIKPAKAEVLVALLAEKLAQRASRMFASSRHVEEGELNPADDLSLPDSKSKTIH